MSNLELMCRAIDYIEENLTETITVADMAASVSLSLYHFARTFNAATHHPPYDYLMRRRLARAAVDLCRGDRRIIDVACEYQFNSPETFSRAFRRLHGMPPHEWRRQGCADRWHLMPRLTAAHLASIARGAFRPVLLHRDELRIAGVMTRTGPDRAGVAELWRLLAGEMGYAPESDAGRSWVGVAYYPRGWETTGYLYLAGVESLESDLGAPGLVAKTLPPQQYIRFTHSGPVSDLGLTLDYVYHTWLPRTGLCPGAILVLEHYAGYPENGTGPTRQMEITLPVQAAAATRPAARMQDQGE